LIRNNEVRIYRVLSFVVVVFMIIANINYVKFRTNLVMFVCR